MYSAAVAEISFRRLNDRNEENEKASVEFLKKDSVYDLWMIHSDSVMKIWLKNSQKTQVSIGIVCNKTKERFGCLINKRKGAKQKKKEKQTWANCSRRKHMCVCLPLCVSFHNADLQWHVSLVKPMERALCGRKWRNSKGNSALAHATLVWICEWVSNVQVLIFFRTLFVRFPAHFCYWFWLAPWA